MQHDLALLAALLCSTILTGADAMADESKVPTRAAETARISAEESARLLAMVEPRFKAIFETNEFSTRSFAAT